MRREQLTYHDLLRKLLAGSMLRRDERQRAEEALAIQDTLEVAVRVSDLLEDLANRGALTRMTARNGDPKNLQRYLNPVTADHWTITAPGPRGVHPSAPASSRPAPEPAAPVKPAAESKPAGEETPSSPASPPPAAQARPAAPRTEPAIPRRSAPTPPTPEPPAAIPTPAAAPAPAPEAKPRLVQAVETIDPAPGIADDFRDAASGEPQRSLFSSFAPCGSAEELAEALAPVREQMLRWTSATDVHFFATLEANTSPAAIPIRNGDATARSLGGRVERVVLRDRQGLHVPNLQARDTQAASTDTGALVVLPLVSGARLVGSMEVHRDSSGAFTADELSFFALGAQVSAGLLVKAEALEKLIFLDRLTGLYNRAYFDDQIEREIERANRMGTSVALFMIDVDHFKRINDSFGHQVGDRALAEVGTMLKSGIRSIDVAARYGGEEFAILLPSINRGRAQRTAERLRRLVADANFGDLVPELDGVPLSISVGFALYPDDAATAKQLIERADRVALYAAKNNGRNRVVSWATARDQSARLKSSD